MKIQCDVCSKDEASVFCCADEAALCDSCDYKVHHANKVASKHQRLSLSSIQTQPLCDICKEKGAYVFCQEDRAILCVNCDDSIHSANKLTMKHSRFLLTGARISDVGDGNINSKTCDLEKIGQDKSTSFEEKTSVVSTDGSSSIISEYLTKTLPGYCVEDLLTDDVNGFYKNHEMLAFSEPEFATAGNDFQIWVPQVQSMNFLQTNVNNNSVNISFGMEKQKPNQQFNVGRKRINDDCFMVPQINSPVASNNYKIFRPGSAWDF